MTNKFNLVAFFVQIVPRETKIPRISEGFKRKVFAKSLDFFNGVE